MDAVEKLVAEIKMTNNGYIFIATFAQLEVAYANRDVFTVFGLGMNGNPKIGLVGGVYGN